MRDKNNKFILIIEEKQSEKREEIDMFKIFISQKMKENNKLNE